MTYFSGVVNNIVFTNSANGFHILKMRLDGTSSPIEDLAGGGEGSFGEEEPEEVSVKGSILGLEVDIGSWFGFEGKWVTDAKWGRQIEIKRAPVLKGDWTPEVVTALLPCRTISASLAKKLLLHFGDNLLESLGDLEALESISGIDRGTAECICERWLSVVAVYKSIDFLHEINIPKSQINKIYATFGDETQKILTENPWALVQVDGISFAQADQVAEKLGLNFDTPLRARGAVLQTAKLLRGTGSLFMSTGYLKTQIGNFASDMEVPAMAQGVQACVHDGLLVSDKEFRKSSALYEPWYYRLEVQSGALLAQRLCDATPDDKYIDDILNASPRARAYYSTKVEAGQEADENFAEPGEPTGPTEKKKKEIVRGAFKEAIHELEELGGFELGEEQVQGILNALVEPVSIITGLPGTGKTTSVKGFVHILQEAGIPFLLLSPTGIAAKRLSSVTGALAYTVHKAFAAGNIGSDDQKSGYVGVIGKRSQSNRDGSEQTWEFGAANPYPADVVLIDECSMVDQHLLFKILECTSKRCRVVFVGDAAQLPSVGPGNVLKEMIQSDLIPFVSLSKIYRQEETSKIVFAAHDINKGKTPDYIFGGQSQDFRFMEVESEKKVLEVVLRLVDKMYEKREKFQVLSPRHRDTLGVTNLNQLIRARLNAETQGKMEVKIGSWTLRENDRIMVTKNNYDLGICNGDTGKIQRIDRKYRKVLAKIHGNPDMEIELPFSDVLRHLRLAYCVTIHKMQGLESDVIIMPFVRNFRGQLQRNLLYTAVTRARKKVYMVGHRGAFMMAVDNDFVEFRNTLLKERIKKSIADPDFVRETLAPLHQYTPGDRRDGDFTLDQSLDYLQRKMEKRNS